MILILNTIVFLIVGFLQHLSLFIFSNKSIKTHLLCNFLILVFIGIKSLIFFFVSIGVS